MSFKPQVRSRHGSHDNLKKNGTLKRFPRKSVIRFGSTTEYPDTVKKGGKRVEINTVNAVNNSADKRRMKNKFEDANVPTAPWWTFKNNNIVLGDTDTVTSMNDLKFPIITKHIHGSRGTGNKKHDTAESLQTWINNKKDSAGNIEKYIFEKYMSYSREYRLHVTSEGCFYTCRKMLKSDTPEQERWFRNDENSVWILETNPKFDKPVNWDSIVDASVDALAAVGLDFGAVDLRVQSATDRDGNKRENPLFFVVEINSAPSFGEITEQKYIEEINNLLLIKTS